MVRTFIAGLGVAGWVVAFLGTAPLSFAEKGGHGLRLHSTGLEAGHAFAVLENLETKEKKWVKVGETVDSSRLLRIERGRVVLLDQSNRSKTTLSLLENGEEIPPLFSSPKDQAQQGEDLDAFLNNSVTQEVQFPSLISESDHRRIITELQAVTQTGEVTPSSQAIIIGGGEEWVSGMKTTSPLQSMGIEREDLILSINGMSPDPSQRRWNEILNVIKRSKLIIFSYIRDEEVHSKVLQVAN